MCGRVNIGNKIYIPGQQFIYRTQSGAVQGRWGVEFGSNLVYNARLEKTNTTWKNISSNRGILFINGFYEQGRYIISPEGQLQLATLFIGDNNSPYDFVVITRDSQRSIKQIHHRMPLIVEDTLSWINDGGIDPDKEFDLKII